ncbi:MAG: 4Fe-4S dicluster domain-containing protein [Desulfobacterales bacterium]|nr:4Fe-4S dicluster domain-containing protein [Desulfobacterales bacterium]
MKEFRHLPGVSSLSLNQEACVGCGVCEAVCPHGVLFIENRKARVVDKDGCMECGACALNCPSDAVSVTPGVGCAEYIIKTWLKGKGASASRGPACC